MDPLLLATPFLIAGSALLLLLATWGMNTLAKRSAQRYAARPRFTSDERQRLRVLRDQYRHDPDRRS